MEVFSSFSLDINNMWVLLILHKMINLEKIRGRNTLQRIQHGTKKNIHSKVMRCIKVSLKEGKNSPLEVHLGAGLMMFPNPPHLDISEDKQ